MRVTLERSALVKGLTHVHRVVERRNTIPILSNVLLRAADGTLGLRATDLDLEVTETVPAEVAQPGATTVPAHTLYDIVRKLPEGAQVSLSSSDDGTSVQLEAGRAKFTLQALPEADFPDLTAGDMDNSFTIEAGAFKRLIAKTQFAISTEETRYYLNGIFLHCTDGDDGDKVLRAVATDGHRLARVDITAPDGADGMPGIIVPRKAVAEIDRLIETSDSPLSIELSDSKIRFTIGAVVLTSKLIDGTFPDYTRVIPSGHDKILQVDTRSFERAVDLVSTVSSERGRAVKLSVGDGHVVLTVNNPDSGTAMEEITASYDAEPIDIGFNARYLLDIAGQLESSEARFELSDPGSPTLVRDGDDASALYVLMPMRV
ncbi:MAG: DNA polymerase III subunit beta [Rhodobiaceae bacterium]|nr:DNA polymerase III subunit beta [Rhodobiaceae bacterium]MCC0012687.1 DNA polymerase III subunit beta [Rhodobiaceae bacterium]MCC0018006.1 DNA polymerase III subunit beta [Rhodobiaceae bacterium]MCC0062042.1 DNA polymerase III subunit beta [Rhodobiaceae bacterium]